MFTDRSTRRGFGARVAVLLPGLGFAGMTGKRWHRPRRASAPSRAMVAFLSIALTKRMSTPETQPCGPSSAFLPCTRGCERLLRVN